MYVIDNCQQLDITPEQADLLVAAGLIYNPDPENLDYFTTPWDKTLGDVEQFLARKAQEL